MKAYRVVTREASYTHLEEALYFEDLSAAVEFHKEAAGSILYEWIEDLSGSGIDDGFWRRVVK